MCHATRACSTLLAILLLSIPFARAEDRSISLEAKLGETVMKSGETQRNYVRIGINGCEQEKTQRPPVNVSFVIDRSGSMQGSRIAQAQEAAISAIKRLDRNDIASVIMFDDRVDVLVPAQEVSEPGAYINRIRQITARGNTAIYAGVNEGASQVRKFKDNLRLNRVVLLSDGLANVGPSRPDEFAQLGATLLAEGISVSTIGLGLQYNEDLMAQLARASDGNHAFVSESADLVQIFNKEFDDVLSACAQSVSIDIELNPGLRVVRSMSRDGKIEDRRAQFRMNQIYQSTEHYVLLEVEVDKSVAAGEQDLGRVRVAYTTPKDGQEHKIETGINGRFSTSKDEISASRNNTVLEAVVEQTARERAATAVKLRDAGRSDEARALFKQNATEIGAFNAAAPAPSPRLQKMQQEYDGFAQRSASEPAQWSTTRKRLRELDSTSAGEKKRF
jgi:Ca-activated chloride channel homolog